MTTHHEILGESIDYARLRAILGFCLQEHKLCRPASDPVLKSINLIDVETRTMVEYPADICCEYIALSYVWGSAKAPKFKTGELSDLLPVIDDAIVIVQALGLKYLWVDAVCIEQASDSHKMSQIKIMDRIYGGAFATIVALTWENAHSRLPRVRPQCDPAPRKSDTELEDPEDIPFVLERGIDDSVWATRGWTFQEAMFSRRCLLLLDHDIYYHCHEAQRRESSQDHSLIARHVKPRSSILAGILSDTRGTLDNPFLEIAYYFKDDPTIDQKNYFFSVILRKYFPRQFSNDADAVNAYAGVLHQFQMTLFKEDFILGCRVPISGFQWAGLIKDYPFDVGVDFQAGLGLDGS